MGMDISIKPIGGNGRFAGKVSVKPPVASGREEERVETPGSSLLRAQDRQMATQVAKSRISVRPNFKSRKAKVR